MELDEKSLFLLSVGQRITKRRKQLRLTQADLAEKADLSNQFISVIESGKQGFGGENIVKLCKALEVSIDYLLTGQHNLIDVNRVTSLFQQFDTNQLFCAEEILRTLLASCKYNQENGKSAQ